MPRFSRWEKWVLRATDRRDLFAESFREPKRSLLGHGDGDGGLTSSPVLEMDLGQVINPGSLSNSSSFSSLSLPGSPPPPTPLPKSLPPSLDLFQDEAQQPTQVASASLYSPSHGLPSSGGSFSNGDHGRRQRDTHVFETSATLEGTTLPMSIPLTNFHEEVGEVGRPPTFSPAASERQLTNLRWFLSTP